jgi:HK97 family phage portal protein
MGLISSLETRSGGVNDPNMWIGTALERAGYTTKSGVTITADTALKISTVYACVTILAQTVASLPMVLTKKIKPTGHESVDDHPLSEILHDDFNLDQSSYEAREMGIGHLKLRGNWYNRIQRDGAGRITALVPMNPKSMIVKRYNGEIWYEYQPGGEGEDPLGNRAGFYIPEEVWHVKGFSDDGITGLSTISYARESMGMAKAQQDFQAEFFGRQAVPGSILEHPHQLGANARKNLKESLDEYATSRRRTTLILEEGLKWQSVGISNKDAQFIELSGASVRDIARWFGVPLVLLQEPEKVATYASVEQFMLSYAKLTVWLITRRIEQSANKRLLSQRERKLGLCVKLNLKGMLEGDFRTRMEGYKMGREGGWLSADDIRGYENMPPIPDGKGQIFLQPLNYVEAGTEPNKEEPKEPEDNEPAE